MATTRFSSFDLKCVQCCVQYAPGLCSNLSLKLNIALSLSNKAHECTFIFTVPMVIPLLSFSFPFSTVGMFGTCQNRSNHGIVFAFFFHNHLPLLLVNLNFSIKPRYIQEYILHFLLLLLLSLVPDATLAHSYGFLACPGSTDW